MTAPTGKTYNSLAEEAQELVPRGLEPESCGRTSPFCAMTGIPWKAATDLGPVAFAFPPLDDRWCNCGVKQSASDRPPSDLLCAQTQPTARFESAREVYPAGSGAADRAPAPCSRPRIDCPCVPAANHHPAAR